MLLRLIIVGILGLAVSVAVAAWRHVPEGPDPLAGRMQEYITKAVQDLPNLGAMRGEAERAEGRVLSLSEVPADEAPATAPSTGDAPATGEAQTDQAQTDQPQAEQPQAEQPQGTAPGVSRQDAVVMANEVREEVRTLLALRERIQFWYEVMLGTLLALFGALLGGIGRRRLAAVEYP